jgi:hypothetical protein
MKEMGIFVIASSSFDIEETNHELKVLLLATAALALP